MTLLQNVPSPQTIWEDFVQLVFPSYCIACYDSLLKNEQYICTNCRHTMPTTNYHLFPDNSLAQRFWGRINIAHAFAYLKYIKYGKVQQIIHSLKYEGLEEIGEMMGKWYGTELKHHQLHQAFDLILPIPLHPNRKKQRGYNQSDSFAKGLSEILQTPWGDAVLIRQLSSKTQTRKKRLDRWENVKDIFAISEPAKIEGKRVLLVDDVITTGATIEACARKIVNSGCKSISVAAIATAY